MKKAIAILLTLVLVLGLAACASQSTPASDAQTTPESSTPEQTESTENTTADTSDAQKNLILVNNSMTDDFTINLDAGMSDVCAENGWKYELMDANGDAQQFITLAENAIVKKPDILAVNVVDSDLHKDVCEEAMNKGITVVAIGNLPNCEVDVSGKSNNYSGGQQCGEYLAKAIGGKGEIVVVLYTFMNEVHTERYQGFKDVIDQYPDITISEVQYAEFTVDSGVEVAENLLTAHPNAVGAFCSFSTAVVGFGRALEEIDKTDFCLTGIDGDKEVLKGIYNGWIDFTSAQENTYKMAQGVFGEAVKYLNGEDYVKETLYDHIPISKDNLEESYTYLYGGSIEDYINAN